jgi:tetratricopeptide (TPR) repeat protein
LVLSNVRARKYAPRIAVLTFLLWGSAASAQFDIGLVLPFENNARDPKLDWVSESFVETLTANLGSPRLLMIDRRERAAAFDSLGMPSSSILTSATVYRLAQVLDADLVVLGRYDYQDGVFTASAQVLNMEGPSLGERFTESGPLSSLLSLQSGLAWRILRSLRPEYPFSRDEYIADRKGPRLDAFENYVRGLISLEKGPQIRFFRQAQRLDPQYTKPAFELGMTYFQDRDYRTTALWLSKLREGDDNYLEANYFLGLAYLYLGQYERSAAAFRVVERQLPLHEVYNNLGIALIRLDQPGAIQYFEKAAQGDPDDPDYRFNLGYSYWRRGDCAEAVESLAKLLESHDDAFGRRVYVDCLRRLGRVEEAGREAVLLPAPDGNKAVDPAAFPNLERPKDHQDGASLRHLYRQARVDEESAHSEISLREHAELHYQRARELLQTGLERQAVEELQLVIDYDPEDPRPYRDLATLHWKAGRLEEALKSATRALHWEQTPEGHLLLARIYVEQGKVEEARAQLDAAMRLDPNNTAAAALREELNARSLSR